MRVVLACLSVLTIACGSNSKGGSDAPAGGGDSGGGGDSAGGGGDGGGGGGGSTIHVTLNHRPQNAAMFTFLVAYQDGSGPWQVAAAPSGDVYSFNVSSPSWGVVWTCIGNGPAQTGGGQIRQVTEAHFAVAERTSLAFDVPPRCTDSAGTVALTGTVSNLGGGGGGFWLVDFGGKTGFVNPQSGAYRVEANPGTADVVLLHVQANGGGDFTTTDAYVDRGVTVSGATTHDLDASAVIATQAFNVNVVVPNNGRATATTQLYTAGGTTATLDRVTQNYESDALAATQGASGDVYDQQIAVSANGQTGIVTTATATPGDQTYTAPTPLGGATSQVTGTTPYPIIHTTWTAYASTIGYAWTATQTLAPQQCGTNTGCSVVWTALLSPGVTGSSPGYTIPDFSALAGWSNNLAFATGATVTGYAEAGVSSAGATDFPPVTPPPAGTHRTYVRSAFTVTP